ncbi:MAG TPA: zinc-dependent metalloprotease [Microthrixaceae bacterium]|nr:zinc-dependent metalloprotease [Microthrixaceae bacterium]
MAGAVDWAVAERVAVRFAGTEPFSRSYHYDSLAPDFDELTAQAQTLVERHTGWSSSAGDARARVADRSDWIRANIASFQRMLRPLTERLDSKLSGGALAPIAGRFAGAEMGAVLGWMSTRVLGQYDMLVLEDEDADDQDIVYYVGPNILALEKRFGFPPREFRLWVALHEVTHRTQFTGVPWLRPYFLSLMNDMLGHVDPDPAQLFRAVGRVADAVRTGHNPLADGGVLTLLASDDQRATMDRIGGLMSLLEGHGDVTMDRAGGDRIPSADRFGSVLRQRRQTLSGPVKLLQRLIGLEAKLAQYEQGERFIEAVENTSGSAYLGMAFESPEQLPTLAEIRDPDAWMRRVRPYALAAGS